MYSSSSSSAWGSVLSLVSTGTLDHTIDVQSSRRAWPVISAELFVFFLDKNSAPCVTAFVDPACCGASSTGIILYVRTQQAAGDGGHTGLPGMTRAPRIPQSLQQFCRVQKLMCVRCLRRMQGVCYFSLLFPPLLTYTVHRALLTAAAAVCVWSYTWYMTHDT